MKILMIAGTGAIGSALMEILSGQGHEIYITSRSCRKSCVPGIRFIQGNALDDLFIAFLLSKYNFDAIVDFGNYEADRFLRRKDMYLSSADLYMFMSTSRVYAENGEGLLNERSGRLSDLEPGIPDHEYAICKAHCEDMLLNSQCGNWTIIRPYITYNTERLQLGVYEKEQWLARLLNNKPLIIPARILECKTTMTYAADVARRMAEIIYRGREGSGEIFQIASMENRTWKEILKIYLHIMRGKGLGVPDIYVTYDDTYISRFLNVYQYENDRLYDRCFDSSKADKFTGQYDYMPLEGGLEKCLGEYVRKPAFVDGRCHTDLDYYMDTRVRWKDGMELFSEYGERENTDTGREKLKASCFGGGNNFRKYIDQLKGLFDIQCVADNDLAKQGRELCAGIQCVPPEKLAEHREELVIVMPEDGAVSVKIINQLMNMGVTKIEHVKNLIRGE